MNPQIPTEEGDNRRHEYAELRREIYEADRACLLMMGFLLTATASAGSAAIGLEDEVGRFLLWILSPLYFVGFWYFTEKRFVIIRITAYIRDFIEPNAPGMGWCSFLRDRSVKGKVRAVLPFDPYHLEMLVTSLGVLGIPAYGYFIGDWSMLSWEIISSLCILAIFLVLLVRALIIYGRPLEHSPEC